MAEKFPYGKRYWYPHMKPGDVAIWDRFMVQFPQVYDEVMYDFEVGGLPKFDTTVNSETGGSAASLYRRKIDVLAFKKGEIDIIEVKPNASPQALGQLAGYGELYRSYVDPEARPKLVLITDRLLTDMNLLAYKLGVTLVVV